jgi:hypothetical protein
MVKDVHNRIGPRGAVAAAIADRFRHMPAAHGRLAFKVGERARNAKDPVITAGGKS